MATPIPSTTNPDVVLIGAGIMSTTLAVVLKELDPSLKIEIYEVLGSEAQESSNAWNNAGTGQGKGTPLSRRNLLNRQFKPTCKRLGLEGVSCIDATQRRHFLVRRGPRSEPFRNCSGTPLHSSPGRCTWKLCRRT